MNDVLFNDTCLRIKMESRNFDNNKNHKVLRHYVAKKNSTVTCMSRHCDVNVSTLRLGMLVKCLEDLMDGTLLISVTDVSGSKVWFNTEWCCQKTDLIPVSQEIWRFLLAVSVPQERVRLANNKSLCGILENLSVNDKVWYHSNHKVNDHKELAIIKYIGPVPKLGQGFYFGLDIPDSQELSKTSMLCSEYFESAHSNRTFATLNKISLYKVDVPNRNTEQILIPKPITQNVSTNLSDKKKFTLDPNLLDVLETFSPDSSKNNNNNNCNSTSLPDEYHYAMRSLIPQNTNNKSGNMSEENGNKNCRRDKSSDLIVGSNVKVLLGSDLRHGTLRWIGTRPDTSKLMAAVELDEGHPSGTDGIYKEIRYFQCQPYRAVFTDIEQCFPYESGVVRVDDRYPSMNTNNFGNMENVITGMVRPISVKGNLESICGKFRGIQGHHNSCYLDATLFSMFAFTSVFDNLLFRPPNEKDCHEYEEVQKVLREEIVNPLRKNIFVSADRVMKLRTLLEKLSSVSGLTSEEKDPEEFLTSLVAQILNAEPFLKLSSGQDAYHYQLFVEKDDHLSLPTVQQLLEQSFFTSNIRLKEVPSCLIIQMPRFGKSFKMYQKIQPTLLLDVTDIIEDSPRQCTVCGKLAEFECKECYGECGEGLESIAFCVECLKTVHRHEHRTNHEPKKLSVPVEFAILQEHCPVPRLYLELSAVVCIETSHYVSFVKCGSGSEAPWCFFDSMADRKGEQDGYNIPEMVPCPDFPYWLSEEGGNYLMKLTDDRNLPEYAKRLLCDAYMCMYQSPDVMMYK
ncbi:ubiquitin carboxyl-terminal hydrolase CYLD isoform X1 [Vespa velutina]|uniref:ubiquitin carboxyl-terminal hydrolase CYLD isoform X1 n=1 Tax=Vespa velutina TaxID=202808 RepID=UPI001FB4ECBA|nr:ubiquitin carboxyl-terminal hydrolase CYLD isoform X1 [Vespa velutina]XP_047361758.1 ubiquitin carboxyl-terminal hydrolase CYLD isoform X1 [Vespa velutina]XP_047361759.1 ubiquitin carboxyl-terminal hydrolase CYLD isoform X1 [Vespa velutina]